MKLEVLSLSYNQFNNSIFSSLAALSNLKSLYIGGNNLKGAIHIQELNALSNLVELDMSDNEVIDFVPSQDNENELKLVNLEMLDLRWNLFNNSILSSLGRLSNLKSLYLGGENLEGSIDLGGLDALTNLENLHMRCNGLRACSFPLQSLGLFPLLKTLHLDGFSFYGTLTTQRLDALTNLEELYMSCESSRVCSFPLQSLSLFPLLKTLSLNGFSLNGTWTIQNNETKVKLMNLEVLELSGNLFNISILPSFGRLSNLEYLSLSCQNLEKSRGLRACSLPLESLNLFPLLKTLFLDGFSFFETWTTQSPPHLKNLESLSIWETSLENNVLNKIGAMPSLKYLELWDCELNGILQTQAVCESTNLQKLDLGNNNLEGNLPECFSNLTSLQILYLDSNHLSGNISALKSLTSLEILYLSNNNFEIPDSLGPLFNLSKLQDVFVGSNTIYADSEMHSLAPTFQLKSISLSYRRDVGSFPQFLYHQHDLQYVDLSNINLIGEFPNWLLKNNSNLHSLDLANNSLLGHFELTFHSHKVLSYLDISKNSFYDNIPNEIGAKLPSLWVLNMSNNNFNGSIPDSIGHMNSLQILDLSNNKLTGGVPEHLAVGCSSLNSLILSNNRLQGQMFSSNFNLTKLKVLRLDGNHFSGKISDCLSKCSILSALDLSNNKLYGEIPSWMGNMSDLKQIVMASNQLEGLIPMEFCQLNLNLELLDLSVNNISGSLPSCFSPLWISQVHLSRNKLEGPLTSAFRNSTSLVTLDLSNNHLNGSIPNWIGRLSQLSYLLLSNNHFEGRIPLQLCKLGHLKLIDLSTNNLSGPIPPCLKITTENYISQEILTFVDISFSIEEPIEFTTKSISYSYKGKVLGYLSGIDLSCNKLIGEIPHEVKNFQKIIVLNLSHNSLTGTIPPAISDLKQIESLDLSHNKLSGKIPSQFVALNFLVVFSVAYNNLSGSTPERIAQFALFEESSYLGNRFLCGAPLPKCSPDGPSSSSVPKTSTDNGSIDNGSIDMDVFYVSFVMSYIIVLLSIAAALYINPNWRQAWFNHIEADISSCYYFVVDNLLPKRFH